MKIMKHTISVLILATVLAGAGCVKNMDMQLDDRIPNERATYEQLARAYDHLRAAFSAPASTSCSSGFTAGGYMMAGYCDEAQEVYRKSAVYNYYSGFVAASEMPLWWTGENSGTERWQGLFNSIFACNAALTFLEDPTLVTDYEEAQKIPMIAQFYALRGYAYLQLIKRYGGVPIVDHIIGREADYSQYKRASFAQCVDFIIENCDRAMEIDSSLPWFTGSQSLLPQLSRFALCAVKSEAALYAASPLWADDCAGTEPYTWERAAAITKEMLDLCIGHGAALVDASTVFPVESSFGETPYEKYFLAAYPSGASWDTETLYQPYNYGWMQSVVWQWAGLPIDVGQYSAGACPTQQLVDAYDVVSADGTRAVPLLDLADPYDADGNPRFNQAALDMGYVDCSARMYENRDPRFYATVYYDGVTFDHASVEEGPLEIQTYVGGNCALSFSPANRRNTCTGYYLRKFSNPGSGADAGNKCGYMRMFRLAELYLNFAEAAAMARGADASYPATTVMEADSKNPGLQQPVAYGAAMSARQAVDAVRARVKMPGIEESGEAFLLRLRNERRVELAFEEHRFFDVRRWQTPDGDLSATDRLVSGMRITKEGETKSYERFHYERKSYTNKYLKYPLDLEEVRKMLHHSGDNWQNPGWN